MAVFDFLSMTDGIVEIQRLPLVHTAPQKTAEKILLSNCIAKKFCGFFKEDLLYFFYARPAKRTTKAKLIVLDDIVPVVFIVKSELDEIKRVFPFDSGAYEEYIKYKYLNPDPRISYCDCKPIYRNSNIYKYVIPNSFSAIIQYVDKMYGDNTNYCFNKYKGESELSPTIINNRKKDKDLDNVLNLIYSPDADGLKDRHGLDDRRRTVEIQTSNDYHLSNNLLAVICPNNLLNNGQLIDKIVNTGAELIPYDCYEARTVEEHIRIIYNKTIKYYANKEYIKGKSA